MFEEMLETVSDLITKDREVLLNDDKIKVLDKIEVIVFSKGSDFSDILFDLKMNADKYYNINNTGDKDYHKFLLVSKYFDIVNTYYDLSIQKDYPEE